MWTRQRRQTRKRLWWNNSENQFSVKRAPFTLVSFFISSHAAFNTNYNAQKNPPEGGCGSSFAFSDPIPNPLPKELAQNIIGDSEF